jgi:hypothetical protein
VLGGTLYTLLTLALEGGGWSALRPGLFSPGKYPVLVVKEAGWAPGPVWTCAKNLAHTGIRSPDRESKKVGLEINLSKTEEIRGNAVVKRGVVLTVSLLMSYIYGAPSKARNLTYI